MLPSSTFPCNSLFVFLREMATTTTTAVEFLGIRSLPSFNHQLRTPKNVTVAANFAVGIPNSFSTLRIRRSSPARASNSGREDDNLTIDTSKEDFNYWLKLAAGSFAGAAVIKYGSVLFPEITRPNIVQALIMIFAPVILSVFLLIKQSRVDR